MKYENPYFIAELDYYVKKHLKILESGDITGAYYIVESEDAKGEYDILVDIISLRLYAKQYRPFILADYFNIKIEKDDKEYKELIKFRNEEDFWTNYKHNWDIIEEVIDYVEKELNNETSLPSMYNFTYYGEDFVLRYGPLLGKHVDT